MTCHGILIYMLVAAREKKTESTARTTIVARQPCFRDAGSIDMLTLNFISCLLFVLLHKYSNIRIIFRQWRHWGDRTE